jgi:hypothetical protein
MHGFSILSFNCSFKEYLMLLYWLTKLSSDKFIINFLPQQGKTNSKKDTNVKVNFNDHSAGKFTAAEIYGTSPAPMFHYFYDHQKDCLICEGQIMK